MIHQAVILRSLCQKTTSYDDLVDACLTRLESCSLEDATKLMRYFRDNEGMLHLTLVRRLLRLRRDIDRFSARERKPFANRPAILTSDEDAFPRQLSLLKEGSYAF
jgi:hypothetical protein